MTARTVDPVYIPFAVTVQPGTLPGAPLITPLDVPGGVLETVDLRIPAGHSGQTGIRFTLSGQQVLPWSNVASWIIDDDMRQPFDVDVEVDTKLAAVTFNTGNYQHTFYMRLRVRQLTAPAGVPVARLITNGAL